MSVLKAVGATMLAAVVLFATSALAQEPTLHDVYQAAQSGNFAQAQRMMDEVLSAHPNSGKAHYVEAELLAQQGRLSAAAAELNTAERLEPGLPFAKPESVRELKARVGSPARGFGESFMPAASPTSGGGIPWGMLLIGAGVVALIVLGVRAMNRRNATALATGGVQSYNPNAPMQASGMPSAGSGLGSGILGGLATGAAVGAGMVAGEALAHRFMGGRQDGGAALPQPDVQGTNMGGTDFGVADNTSWDDGFGGIGGDGGGDWS